MSRPILGLVVALVSAGCAASGGGGGGGAYVGTDAASGSDVSTGGATDAVAGADALAPDTKSDAGDSAVTNGDISAEGLCLANACKTEFTACSANALCKAALKCIASCAPSDGTCINQCAAAIGSDATAQVVTNAALVCIEKAAPSCGGTTKPCGNGKCDAGETTANCPADCPAPTTCGPYVKPATDPGCTGSADQAFVDTLLNDSTKSGSFADQVRDCTLTHGCMAKGTDCPTEAGKLAIQGQCIAQCVVENLDPAVGTVSANCAWCYGAYSGACGFNHCLAECATDTPQCTPCLAQWCDTPRDACKAGQ